MSGCSHNCGSCGESCGERTAPQDMRKQPHQLSHIKKVIGIVSGKGGVGKSFVTSMLACLAQKNGYKTAVLDADITGPSIPKLFGLNERASATELGLIPSTTKNDIDVMSLNLLLESENQPVIWRGAVISSVVEQFWTEVIWGEVDFMFVDMPPGTGDVPLTVFQSLPVDGIVIVASPQELVQMIVEKAVNMANMMDIPILGMVENMSYLKCPDCGKEIKVFGESHVEETAAEYGIPLIGKIPIDPEIASLCDKGAVDEIGGGYLDSFADILKALHEDSYKQETAPFKIAVTHKDGKVFEHFGHSEEFKIYTFVGNDLAAVEVVKTDGQGHGAIVGFLKEQGVQAVICGGIGEGARSALEAENIFVFGGVSGECDKVIQDWFNGTLQYDPDIACANHADGDQHCGGGSPCGSCH
ncbi:MAG: P-loop NTPase [Candidatus Ornithomonoglobus sp.]